MIEHLPDLSSSHRKLPFSEVISRMQLVDVAYESIEEDSLSRDERQDECSYICGYRDSLRVSIHPGYRDSGYWGWNWEFYAMGWIDSARDYETYSASD